MLELASLEKQTYYLEVVGSMDASCLSFYYYITRPNAGEIAILCTDIIDSTVQQIGKVSDVLYNGWHYTEFSFTSHVDNYRVRIRC